MKRVCDGAVLSVLWALAAVSSLSATAASAAQFRGGSQVEVAPADTIHDDLYASGGDIQVRGAVDGDLVIAGGKIVVSGAVTGDVLATGGNLVLDGPIGGTVRACGGSVTVGGAVTHDLVVAGGRIKLARGAEVGRDLVVAGGAVRVAGKVGRNMLAGTGRLELMEGAHVRGNLRYASRREMQRDPGATVDGKVRWVELEKGGRRSLVARLGLRTVVWVRGLIGLFALGLVLVLGFPGFATRAAERLAQAAGPSLALGLGLFVGIPLAAGVVFVLGLLIGGWWLGMFAAGAWLLGLACGYVLTALKTGQWLAARFGGTGARGVWALLLGLVALGILVSIPFLGLVVGMVASVVGLGAAAMALRSRVPEAKPAG